MKQFIINAINARRYNVDTVLAAFQKTQRKLEAAVTHHTNVADSALAAAERARIAAGMAQVEANRAARASQKLQDLFFV
jgi:hypothetical protein